MTQKTITLSLNVTTKCFKRIKFYHASGSTPNKGNASANDQLDAQIF